MTFRAVFAALLGVLLSPSFAGAAEIENDDFGFRCTIPDGFYEDQRYTDPDSIYQFLDRKPSRDSLPNLILFLRLRRSIGSEMRFDLDSSPPVEGTERSVEPFMWGDRKVEIMRRTSMSRGGYWMVVYTIDYPLDGEAVRLQVGGPIERDAKLRSLFSQVANSFANTRPLPDSAPASASGGPMAARDAGSRTPVSNQSAPSSESKGIFANPTVESPPLVDKSHHSGPILLAQSIFTILAGLFGLWFISKKLPRGALLGIAVGFFLLGIAISEIRVRGIVMFAGSLQVLGTIGGILGLLDIFRKRKPAGSQQQPQKTHRPLPGNHAPPKKSRPIPKCDRSRLNQPIRR